jgi:hypothetical protein
LFQLFAAGVNDTGGKFAAGVVHTGGNLPPASLAPPPVSLTPLATQGKLVANFATSFPVVHLDLRISPRIFEKIY